MRNRAAPIHQPTHTCVGTYCKYGKDENCHCKSPPKVGIISHANIDPENSLIQQGSCGYVKCPYGQKPWPSCGCQ